MKYLQVGILVALIAVAGLLALNLMNDSRGRVSPPAEPAVQELAETVDTEEQTAMAEEEMHAAVTREAATEDTATENRAAAPTPTSSKAIDRAPPAQKPTPTPQQTAKRSGSNASADPAPKSPPASSEVAKNTEPAPAGPSRTEPFQVDPPSAQSDSWGDSAESTSTGQERNRYELMRPDPPSSSPTAPNAKGTVASEPPRTVTLPAGTILTVRTTRMLSSETASLDEAFTATLDQPIVVDDMVIAERGSRVEGRVVQVVESGRVKGVAALSVQVIRINTSDGQTVPVQTQTFTMEAESSKGRDATKVGIATGIGAALGAIFGGGRGAAIGAAAGAGAGTGGVLAGKGKPAEIPSETRINFRLESPLTITEKINP